MRPDVKIPYSASFSTLLSTLAGSGPYSTVVEWWSHFWGNRLNDAKNVIACVFPLFCLCCDEHFPHSLHYLLTNASHPSPSVPLHVQEQNNKTLSRTQKYTEWMPQLFGIGFTTGAVGAPMGRGVQSLDERSWMADVRRELLEVYSSFNEALARCVSPPFFFLLYFPVLIFF